MNQLFSAKTLLKSIACRSELFRVVCSIRNYSQHSLAYRFEYDVSVGERFLQIQSGKLARFANGSATVKCGDTSVLVTAVSGAQQAENFTPLTVDYRQKCAAVGRIPTNHLRRELGPTPRDILTSRMIDRSLRPFFPEGYNVETQITCNLLAVDSLHDPDVLCINAASTALALSSIPWHGPIGAVRVGYVKDKIVVNPTRAQLRDSQLDLVLAATTPDRLVMLDGSAKCIPHEVFNTCLQEGVKQAQNIVAAIQEIQYRYGKQKADFPTVQPPPLSVLDRLRNLCEQEIRDIYSDAAHDKISRDNAINELRKRTREQIIEAIKQEGSYLEIDQSEVSEAFYSLAKQIFRTLIFERNLRCDGRALDALRPISCQVDLYPQLHGSALFQRGQTQVLSTLSFDSPYTALKLDPMSALLSGESNKRFFLHYEFPPYATNEVKVSRGSSGRREQGHGALAEKGLQAVVPRDYPLTIRLTAEVLESNGSSSMASVCAGSLALMDAGVPISEAVAGVAIGIVTRHDDQGELEDYRILSDILGIEDYMGDMDLKVAGTERVLTAVQADIKLSRGLPVNVAVQALDQAAARKGNILAIMNGTQSAPRASPKPNHPVTKQITVDPAQRARFTGVGGLNLRRWREDSGVEVTAVDANGVYSMFAPNQEAMEEVEAQIADTLQQDPERLLDFGGIYKATVVELRESGVMVQLYPNMKPAFLHNSQLDHRKILHPSALGLEVGHEIDVKYFGRDPVTGAMRLSRKVLTMPEVPRMRNLFWKT